MTPAGTPATTRAVVAAGVLALLVALPAIGVRATYGAQLTSDEPHYLITAISLAEDGDLDVSDELDEERWRPFHEAQLPVQERVLDDGRQLAPHDPLLPALLAVPWALGGWVGAKAALALLAGILAALTTWTAIRRFDVRPATAGTVVSVLSAAWPLSGYATQVYPELPAALVVVAIVAVALSPGRPGRGRVVTLAGLVSALPWLAIKYVPVAAALTGVLVWQWWKAGHRPQIAWVTGLLGLSGLAYLGLHRYWYGGWTVYAAADHFVERGEFAVVGFDPNLPGRARRLVGLLVDRDFGLAAWQPLWLLAVPGLAVWVRRRPSAWAWLVVPFAAGWLNATFVALTMQGWWVPGRQVVVVLPLAGMAMAWWLDRARPAWRAAAVVLGAMGVLSYAWLVSDGLQRRLTWVVDFAGVGDPLYALRRAVLPNYLQVSPATWAWQALWLLVAALLAWVAVHQDRRLAAGPTQPASDDSAPDSRTTSRA